MSKNLNNGFSSNVPTYVSVYNSLYSDIINGEYIEEQSLPSEMCLAKKYGVSRNTLRQALAILSEDGLIIKLQGKGTIVAKRTETTFLKNNFNPMTHLSVDTITDVDYYYNFNPPTEIARDSLELQPNDIILASNNIYRADETAVGFSFVQIPTKYFDELQVDSSCEDDIKLLINEKIFENTLKSNMSIKLIFANEIEVSYLGVEEHTPLLLIESVMYNMKLQPFARCKFYFIPKQYKVRFQI